MQLVVGKFITIPIMCMIIIQFWMYRDNTKKKVEDAEEKKAAKKTD